MSSPVTVHVALMPSVIGCRGSAVFRRASPHGPGPQTRLVRAQLRAPHHVVLLGVAPRVLLRRRPVEPHDALAVVVHEPQQRGIRLCAEPDRLVVIAVPAFEDHDHHVVLVDDLGSEAARVFDHAHAEPPGVFEQGGQPLVVLAEAAVLVVVLDRHVSREDQDVQKRHAFVSVQCAAGQREVVSGHGGRVVVEPLVPAPLTAQRAR